MSIVVCFLSYTEDGTHFFDHLFTVKGVPTGQPGRTGAELVRVLILASKAKDQAMIERTVLALSALRDPLKPHVYIVSNPAKIEISKWAGDAQRAKEAFLLSARAVAADLKSVGAKYATEAA